MRTGAGRALFRIRTPIAGHSASEAHAGRRIDGSSTMREASYLVAGCLCSLAALVAGLAPAAAGDAEDPFTRAAALERAGRLEDAAATLEAFLAYYPQDYALPLQIAALHRRAGRLQLAEIAYRLALVRSPGGVDARVGLAEVLEAEGRPADAEALWRDLAQELPDLPEARAGLARCAPFHLTPSFALAGTGFPDHPYKALAGGLTAGLLFEHRSGFLLGATYEYTRFLPQAGVPLSAWDQHTGFAMVGWAAAAGSAAFTYAALYDGSGALGLSHHLGLSGRWSPYGDVRVEAALSLIRT
jgi:tetratricopeptide (TPR) repeat protein